MKNDIKIQINKAITESTIPAIAKPFLDSCFFDLFTTSTIPKTKAKIAGIINNILKNGESIKQIKPIINDAIPIKTSILKNIVKNIFFIFIKLYILYSIFRQSATKNYICKNKRRSDIIEGSI